MINSFTLRMNNGVHALYTRDPQLWTKLSAILGDTHKNTTTPTLASHNRCYSYRSLLREQTRPLQEPMHLLSYSLLPQSTSKITLKAYGRIGRAILLGSIDDVAQGISQSVHRLTHHRREPVDESSKHPIMPNPSCTFSGRLKSGLCESGFSNGFGGLRSVGIHSLATRSHLHCHFPLCDEYRFLRLEAIHSVLRRAVFSV